MDFADVAAPTNNMAKNRRTIITELFLGIYNDEFDFTEEKLWELDDCVEKKFIKKSSKEREGKQDGVNSWT